MPVLRSIQFLGSSVIGSIEFIGGAGGLLWDAVRSLPAGLFRRRGRRLGWENLWAQMVRVGVRSVPIVVLVVFCIGAILAMQMIPVLEGYGAEARAADIIAIAMVRELGPLVAAIVLTGFAGASIAAEIGSMVVGEEIEALEAHAISPVRLLVAPRVLASAVMMVCLAVVADIVGVLGGMFTAVLAAGLNPTQYVRDTFTSIDLLDFGTGLVKASVFGVIISTLACHLGLRVTGGATGVGNATTRTVVYTIVALITVDLLFTGVFYYLEL